MSTQRRRSYPLPKPSPLASLPPPTPEALESEAKRKAEIEAETASWNARADAVRAAGLPVGLTHAWECRSERSGYVGYELRGSMYRWGSVDVQTAFPLRQEPKDDIRVNGPTPCLDADTFADVMTIYRDIERIVAHIRGALAALPMPTVKEETP